MGAKMLSQQQMEKRQKTSTSLIKMITENVRSFLGNIITMNESAAPMLTPEIKTQS
jgi:hypothetical protein